MAEDSCNSNDPCVPWHWKLLAISAGLLDPVKGVLVGLPGGLCGLGSTRRWDTQQRRLRGLAIVLGGIEGPSIYQGLMGLGLLRGGSRGAIVVHHWNRGVPIVRMFRNL